MAYITVINKALVTRDAAIEEIHTQLLAMGWTYVCGMHGHGALDVPYTDVTVVGDTITKVGHTLVDGDKVRYSTTGTAIGGLAIANAYFVVSVSGNTFKLSTTYGGTAVNITSQGTGFHSFSEYGRIYKSNGEAGTKIYQYVRVRRSTATNSILFRLSYGYNLTTYLMTGAGYVEHAILVNDTGFYIWIHGNKDGVHILTKVVSTYYRVYWGFCTPFFALETTLSVSATTSVIPVELTVADSTGFEAGYSYQIVGNEGEGRDNLTVTAVATGSITVSALPRNYASGAKIGHNTTLFGIGGADSNYAYIINTNAVIGLDDGNSQSGGLITESWLSITAVDPDARLGKYVLQPLSLTSLFSGAAPLEAGGYFPDFMKYSATSGMVIEDTFAVGKLDSGTSSGTNSTTVINDTSKSWTPNAYAAKVVIITFGLGSGMIKKISSNDATSLTLSGEWIFDSVPDDTSQYIICDEGYRYLSYGTGAGAYSFALREGM